MALPQKRWCIFPQVWKSLVKRLISFLRGARKFCLFLLNLIYISAFEDMFVVQMPFKREG